MATKAAKRSGTAAKGGRRAVKVSGGEKKRGRLTPRPFAFHWGGGQITEEAAFRGEYTEPAIQLLEYDGGGYGIRFCYYDHQGRFQRSPMMIDSGATLEGLQAAVRKTPKLRELLRRLAG